VIMPYTPEIADDTALLLAARHNIHAFAPIYERYFPRVYAYCLRRINHPQEAEDLTSQIFTRALTHLDSYRGGVVAAWLFRIAHNVVVNYYRDRRTAAPLDERMAGDQGDLLDGLLHAEEQAVLHDLVAQLSEEQQDLLMLKLVGQLSAPEIGTIIGKSPGAVRVELHRIISHLRQMAQEKLA